MEHDEATVANEATVSSKLEGVVGRLAATRLGPARETEIAPDTPLIELGIMDSLAIFELVAFVEEEFALGVPHDALVPENFATLAALTRMVRSLEPTPL